MESRGQDARAELPGISNGPQWMMVWHLMLCGRGDMGAGYTSWGVGEKTGRMGTRGAT